jgi:hypothetical protein
MQYDAIAAGIFRGEGTVSCSIINRGRWLIPALRAAVKMCDKDSVEIVAGEWRSSVKRSVRRECSTELGAWQTEIDGVNRVRDAILPWIAKGLLKGEKAEQFFEAEAACRRARRVFLPSKAGNSRQQL